MHPKIDRGALLTDPSPNGNYLRYAVTDSGISPRVVPGYEGFVHTVATDEHDEDGVLISDEYTHPHKRRRMVEKRARKFQGVAADVPAPELEGPAKADVTLVGWGSSYGVIREACEILAEQGVKANQLPIKWIVPFHGDEVLKILGKAKKVIIVENNHSGQFARYLRSETGFSAHAHIRKYDGEPFMPHHVVEGVLELVKGESEVYVPYQEMIV
jgi:2-oxoglutarate ferredoxin oxidoreductase subunit alpha